MSGVYLRYLLMRAKVRLAYRGDFLIGVAGELLVAAVGVVFLLAVFDHVPDIRGWTFHEVLMIWGLAETATGLLFVGFQGLWALNQRYLLGGELDRVLLRPLDPYLQVLLDHINLEHLPTAGLGVGMMAIALRGLPPLGLLDVLLIPLLVLGSVGVLGGVLTAVSSAGFRVHHRGTAVGLVYQGAVFSRYPLDVFHRPLRLLLTFGIPFGFVGYYPATWFFGRGHPPWWALIQPLVGLCCMLGGYALWMRASRGYRSPGS